jgi:hypothetical protein
MIYSMFRRDTPTMLSGLAISDRGRGEGGQLAHSVRGRRRQDRPYLPHRAVCNNNEAALRIVILVIVDIAVVDITLTVRHAVFVGRFVNPSELILPTLLYETIAQVCKRPTNVLALPCASVSADNSEA